MGDQDPFAAVARRIVPEGRLRRCWPLKGGVSASMHALEIFGRDQKVRSVVVRRPGAMDWKPLVEGAAATEHALLEALRRLGMEVPETCSLDESGELLPTPYLVMELVEGTTVMNAAELPDALRQMASFLARLHALDTEAEELPALPEREDPRQGILEYLPSIADADRLRAVLANEVVDAPTNPPSLLHGDFWPENILWQHGRIAAVLDWEDAALGDPLSDVACARVELLCSYDEAAMDAFTEHYRGLAKVDWGSLALWEVYVSSAAAATMAQWGLEPEVEAERRRKTEWFLERAVEELLTTLL